MFNASSSKSNSSTRGTLHFTRQPRSCEVAPTLRQFHFQTSVSSITVPVHHFYFTSDVLKMIVCQMNAIYQYQIDGNQWAAKLCLCSLCQFLLTNTVNQEHFNKSMLHRPPSHLAEKTVLLPCKLRKPELSLQGQRKSLASSGSDHLVLEMISMSHEYDVQVVGSWGLFALKVPCTSGFLGQ